MEQSEAMRISNVEVAQQRYFIFTLWRHLRPSRGENV